MRSSAFFLALLLATSPLAVQAAAEFQDVTPPTVGAVSPTQVEEDREITLSFPISDNVGVTSCTLFVDGAAEGLMQVYGNVASKAYVFSFPNNYGVYAKCFDAAGNSRSSAVQNIEVVSASTVIPGQDLILPTVGVLTPQTAVVGTPVTFRASYADNTRVVSCNLFIDGVDQGAMALDGNSASFKQTFVAAGTHSVYVACRDAAGNLGMNALPATVRATTVSGNGLLIKLQCPRAAQVNDPCTTVYFYGSDGLRHAFTSEAAYFSWYNDYGTVQTVEPDFMSQVPLGPNVTYRPGKRLIKFQSVRTVYAVASQGQLRPISSEAEARTLYGSSWNRQIDDVSDIFFGDYHIGGGVGDGAAYDRLNELDNATSPNVLF